jgi:flagellar assembly factor FliW
MSHTIESSRFGRLEIAEEAVIRFPAGLIGIAGSRYTLLARGDDAPFVWLHSLDDASLAIPVTSPFRWFDDYEVELSDEEAARIGVADPADADVWVTVRAGARPEDFSANLLAPILVTRAGAGGRGSRGWQVINDVPGTPVRAPLFEEPAQQVA